MMKNKYTTGLASNHMDTQSPVHQVYDPFIPYFCLFADFFLIIHAIKTKFVGNSKMTRTCYKRNLKTI